MKLETIEKSPLNSRTKHFITFDSIGELVKHCNEAQVNQMFKADQASIRGDYSFTNTRNFDEAMQLVTNGWDSGSKNLTEKLKIANLKQQSKEVKRAINDIVGFQVNVPRYLLGIPTNMVNQKAVKRKQPIITLIKSISYSGAVSADTILEDSVKFLQIVQEIEKKGIRVNIYTHRHGWKGDEEHVCRVKIKGANERLNISKMSFPLTHPSFLRRLMFRVTETELRLKDNQWSGTYGQPATEDQSKLVLKENEYLIPTLIDFQKVQDIMSEINK